MSQKCTNRSSMKKLYSYVRRQVLKGLLVLRQHTDRLRNSHWLTHWGHLETWTKLRHFLGNIISNKKVNNYWVRMWRGTGVQRNQLVLRTGFPTKCLSISKARAEWASATFGQAESWESTFQQGRGPGECLCLWILSSATATS